MEKPVKMVIHDIKDLEQYVDKHLNDAGLTFGEWVDRFGREPYLSRNKIILSLLQPLRPRRIFEFACAGGFLAELLMKELPSIEYYTCTNFSTRMVEYCKDQLARFENCDVKLVDANHISDQTATIALEAYDTFLTTSFEHIQFDCELIQALPVNRLFVFCLAGFDDPEHFRFFSEPDEIRRRYDKFVSIEKIATIGKYKKFIALSRTATCKAGRRYGASN